MPARITSDSQLSRRLRLRDLHVFRTAARLGSMAKAASELGVTQPAVSEVIAGLEHALGVRLLDRTRRGVEPTPFGAVLLKRSVAAFDELSQGVRDIEFLLDPTVGELRIGCPESIAAGLLVPVLERLSKDYPRVKFHVEQVHTPTVEFPELYERKIDLVLARLVKLPAQGMLSDELNAEVLFDDPFSVVVGESSKWARRRNVGLADLVDEPWVMTPLDALGGAFLTKAFRAAGLKPPNLVISTFSIHLRNNLVGGSRFITAMPASVLRVNRERHSLHELPIEMPAFQSPVAVVTLRHRTLSPAVQLFVQYARDVAKSMAVSPKARKR